MAKTTDEIKELSENMGIETASDKKAAEYDLTASLLKAANFKTECQQEIQIKRKGELLFSFTVRPLDEKEYYAGRKNAIQTMKNPNGSKFPAIEKPGSFDMAKFNSYQIYTATIESDRTKIWNNAEIKKAHNLVEGIETVDVLLTSQEKDLVIEIITALGKDDSDDDISPEEYAKN